MDVGDPHWRNRGILLRIQGSPILRPCLKDRAAPFCGLFFAGDHLAQAGLAGRLLVGLVFFDELGINHGLELLIAVQASAGRDQSSS